MTGEPKQTRAGRALAFARGHAVLLISLVLALASFALTPPSAATPGMVDGRVLLLLFCLMAVVAGLQEEGVLAAAAARLLTRVRSARQLRLALTYLCFFASMVLTNDVALVTFVPFTLLVCQRAGAAEGEIIRLVVLETVAANLGSMLTPLGNPQNLYLYSLSGLSAGQFIRLMLAPTLWSLLLLTLCCLAGRRRPLPPPAVEGAGVSSPRRVLAWLGLGAVALAAVGRLVPAPAAGIVVLVGALLLSPRVLRRVDWSLLATFVFFFVFIGNVGAVPGVARALPRLLHGREEIVAAAVSQVVSNVPAAMLLAPFSSDLPALIRGVNIGGLGTLIASMASLISYQYYARRPDARRGRYLLVFTGLNALFLTLLLVLPG